MAYLGSAPCCPAGLVIQLRIPIELKSGFCQVQKSRAKSSWYLLIRVVGKDEKRKPITVKGLLDNRCGSVFAFHPQTMMMIIAW